MQYIVRTTSLAFFLFILWIIYMADTGQHSVFFDLAKSIPYGDKIAHTALYGMFALLMNLVLQCRTILLWNYKLHLGTVIVGIFGGLEEISQAFFVTRSCDWADLGADAVGLVLATLLLKALSQRDNPLPVSRQPFHSTK